MSGISFLQVAGLFLFIVTPSLTEECIPKINCKLPNCRCWNDFSRPGGIPPKDTPQIILMTFHSALNAPKTYTYINFIAGVEGISMRNPNKCDVGATFFAQEKDTDSTGVQALANIGVEFGITSESGDTPSNWNQSYKAMKGFLNHEVFSFPVTGTLAPGMALGGDAQFDAMADNGLVYDTSCITPDYSDPDNMLWPYTYDFPEGAPSCARGKAPTEKHPGLWQFPRPEFIYPLDNGTAIKCLTIADCLHIATTGDDVGAFLYVSFMKHYHNKRTPFILDVDLSVDMTSDQLLGFYSFAYGIPKIFKDAWLINHSQALAWLKNPVNTTAALNFKPWSC